MKDRVIEENKQGKGMNSVNLLIEKKHKRLEIQLILKMKIKLLLPKEDYARERA